MGKKGKILMCDELSELRECLTDRQSEQEVQVKQSFSDSRCGNDRRHADRRDDS
jgi:hypothetical protein